jgi:hypothetical protein
MNDLAAALSAFARNAAAPAQNNHSVAVRVAGSRDGRAFITAAIRAWAQVSLDHAA